MTQQQANDLVRAKQLVTQMMDEFPDKYAARGHAFRVEFFTNENNGEMLAAMREVEVEGKSELEHGWPIF